MSRNIRTKMELFGQHPSQGESKKMAIMFLEFLMSALRRKADIQ